MTSHAMYIGRVGALAVALGVGVMVTSTPSVAWASPGTTSSAGSSASTDPVPTVPSGTTKPTQTVVIAKSGGSHTSGHGSALVKAESSTIPAAKPLVAEKPVTPPTPASTSGVVHPVAASTAVTAAPPAVVKTVSLAAQPATAKVGTVAAVTSTPLPTPSVPAFLALPTTIINTATNVVKTVLASFAATAPGAPPNPPVLFAVLAVVRREFFDQTPKINYTVSKPDTSGNITISLNQTDAVGDTLAYSATNGAKGTVALNADGHSFTYTPAAGQTGTDTVTVTATDPTSIHGLPGLLNALSFGLLGNAGRTATTNVTVTLNTPPTLALTAGTPDASTGAVTVTAVATDTDGDPLSFKVSAPAGGSGTVSTPTVVDAATGTYAIVYTPSEQARHTASADTATPAQQADSFTVSVDDGHGATVTKTVGVAISPENAAPTMTLTSGTPDASTGAVTVTAFATDADGDPLSFKVSAPAGGSGTVSTPTIVNVATGVDAIIVYTPSAQARHAASADTATPAQQADTFTVSVDDGHGGTVTKTAVVAISPADSAPQFSTVTSSTDSNGKVTGTVAFTDAEGDALTYSGATTSTKGGAVTVDTGGNFTYTPTAAERVVAAATTGADTDTFTVTANDGHGGTGTQAVTVTVTPATLPSDPTAADVASDPQTALTVSQSNIMADISALSSAQADMSQTIGVYDPTALLGNLEQVKAQAQTSINAALAVLGTQISSGSTLPDPTTTLENTLGGTLTPAQISTLESEQQTINTIQANLGKSLNTAADATATLTAKAGASVSTSSAAPVYDKVVYTVGAGGSLKGQVTFIDPNGESISYQSPSDTYGPDFNQSGSFTIPAVSPADFSSTITFEVEATDSGGNVTRTQITLDRSRPDSPPADTPVAQTITAFTPIQKNFSDSISAYGALLTGAGGYYSQYAAAQAKEDAALADQDAASAQQFQAEATAAEQTIATVQANELQVITQLNDSNTSLQAQYLAAIHG